LASKGAVEARLGGTLLFFIREPRSKAELDLTAEGFVFSFRNAANDGTDLLSGFEAVLGTVEARR